MKEIRIKHYSPAEISPIRIREFLSAIHEDYHAGEPCDYDLVPYSEKLARFADCYLAVDRESDSVVQGGVLAYCNDMDCRMQLNYYPPTTFPAETIKRFQSKIHAQYTPDEPLNYEPDAYAAKLSNCAEAIVYGLDAADLTGGGGLWGYCNDLASRVAYVSYIAKTKDAPKGLGIKMHEAFRWLAIGRGMERIRLEVHKTNFHAQEFYRKLGYVCAEEREQTYLLERDINENSGLGCNREIGLL